MTATSTSILPTDDSLLAALTSLGDTREEVAAALLAGGCHGYRMHARRCPVANFVRAAFVGADVDVCGGRVYAAMAHAEAEAEMPASVVGFVGDFDAGSPYTQALVEGGPR